jgi:hypothetical protein
LSLSHKVGAYGRAEGQIRRGEQYASTFFRFYFFLLLARLFKMYFFLLRRCFFFPSNPFAIKTFPENLIDKIQQLLV